MGKYLVTTDEQRAKHQVTLVSVAAAALLTGLKLAVGLLTGSLGLLSEAAHSGLDLVASLLTFFSVRIADKPADADHLYGHGRIENLSAILQGVLLILTALGIIYESVRRLVFVHVPVEVSVWTFLVMAISIGIDIWRSRMLLAAARRFHSKALEADALNFRADLLSSTVVIIGLTLTAYGQWQGGISWLEKGDAAAALMVAVFIIIMSGHLAIQGINILLDRAPAQLSEQLTQVAAGVPGVVDVQPVRVRESGRYVFADTVVTIPRTTSLSAAHAISEQIEAAFQQVEPRIEAVVHVEPGIAATESVVQQLRAVALRLGIATHHEQVHQVGDDLEAAVHLEVDPQLALRDAYTQAEQFVAAARQENPSLCRIDTHIEVATPDLLRWRPIESPDAKREADLIALVARSGVGAQCHEVRLYQAEGQRWNVVLHCDFAPDLPMHTVHQATEVIEHAVRQAFRAAEHVIIQAEPLPTGS